MRQVECLYQQVFPGNSPPGNCCRSIRTGKDSHQRDRQNTEQRVVPINRRARICELFKVTNNFAQPNIDI